jgi:hypothetical protein
MRTRSVAAPKVSQAIAVPVLGMCAVIGNTARCEAGIGGCGETVRTRRLMSLQNL